MWHHLNLCAMDLIVNGRATIRSSLGARRYYEGVIGQLRWPGRVAVTRIPRWSRLERLNELLERGRADAVYWSPSHRGPLFAHRHVVTVLDCINVEHTYRGDWRLPLLRLAFGTMLENAAAVVAISHATRDAVLRNFSVDPAKVVVIAGPVDFPTRPCRAALSHIATRDASPCFVLMITNPLPHKNTALAGQAFAASDAARNGTILRVVGALDPAGLAACHRAGVKVEQHHGVDDATLDQWLATCHFLFSPSLDEGLNLPVAEALSRGANVLCSDIPVHREFYDGQVLFCNPVDLDQMTLSINAAFTRPRNWALPGANRPRRSFTEVAEEYRSLFLRMADI